MVADRAPADPSAFVEWVRPYLRPMSRLAARLAPEADRDDVVQESLARAWAKRNQYDGSRGSPSAWLLAITADQARKAVRRRLPVVPLKDALSSPDTSGRSDDRLDVERAIRRLPVRQRLAVDCFYFADLSVAETAAVMGCSEGTVKSTLADARARIRLLLEVPA
ncbi:MAG: RNA polymerase sigma factor [Micromonosporaceae bacterium]